MQFTSPTSLFLQARRAAACLAILTLLATSTGCELFGMIAHAVVPPSVPAVYEIQDRPTLVIVDDRRGLLRDPQLAMLAAAHASDVLRQEKAVTQVISSDDLSALASELGTQYAQTSPYDIGRRLGAKQVILVNVFAASISPEPGILKPSANIGVKLFDIEANDRIFPPSPKATGQPDSPETEGFFLHKVSLRVKTNEANPGRIDAIARQKLAEQIGIKAGLLFTEYDPTPYDDIRTGS